MSDLRKAAEMALNYFESAYELDSHEIKIREVLREALAQPEQEPIAWILNRELFWPSEYEIISEDGDNAIPLYTAPPKPAWQGLTNEEILDEYRQCYGDDGTLTDCYFARAIIIRFKGKNGG